MDFRKLAISIPGFKQLLPEDWAWTSEQMTEQIAQRAFCYARIDVTPLGCPSWEERSTYKSWQSLARRFLLNNPDSADAWIVLAHSSYKLDQFEVATKAYRVAVKFKDDTATWVSLGLCTKQDQETLDAFKHAIELNPNDYLAWQYLGNTYASCGDHLNAINCLKKAISNSGDSSYKTWPLCYLALSYIKLGKFEDVISSLEHCLRLDQSQAFDCLYPEIALACKGTPELAVSLRDRLRKIDKKLANSFYAYYSRLV